MSYENTKTISKLPKPLREFLQGYIECALWSSTDNRDENGGDSLDRFDVDDIDPKCLERMIKDCADFMDALMDEYYDKGGDNSQAGHDFWLTRNRHGAGFWDRGLGEIGDDLTEIAHSYGETSLYLGDNDIIDGHD